MTFLNQDNEAIEYNGEFAITKQALSYFNYEIKGDFSINFKIPNTAKNRRLLNYHGANQSVFTDNAFSLVDEKGNLYTYGKIRVNKESESTIECYFVSGNTNWFDLLDYKLNEMEYSSYFVNYSSFNSRKASTDGITFPLINLYGDITNSDYFIPIPFIFLKSIVKEIALYTGIKFTGTLFNSSIYQNLIISPTGGLTQQYKKVDLVDYLYRTKLNAGQAITGPFSYTKIQFDTLVASGSKGSYSNVNYRYTAAKKASYKITVNATFTVSQPYSIRVYKNGSYVREIRTLLDEVAMTNFNGFGYVNCDLGDYLEIFVVPTSIGPANFTVSAGSFVQYELADKIEWFQPCSEAKLIDTELNDPYVDPSTVVPNINANELIKFLALFFGCALYYDDSTRTVNINLLDALTDTEDWSDYYISHEPDYNTPTQKNNFIKFAEVDEFKEYNDANEVTFGGVNIETDKKQGEKTLYEIPFAPILEEFRPRRVIQTAFIDYLGLEKKDSRIAITSVSDSSGIARFACVNSFRIGDIVEIESSRYNGRSIVTVATATYIETAFAYVVNDVGNVYQVTIAKNDGGENRIALVLPGYTVTDTGSASNAIVYYVNGIRNIYTSSTAPIAIFDKPVYGFTIDGFKQSLSLDSVNGNTSIADIYYKKVKNIINSPRVRAKMLLPLNAFRNFKFDRNIYLNTERLSGSFIVETIKDYKDSVTPVEVTLYKL